MRKAIKWVEFDLELGIGMEICQHSFIENPCFYHQPHSWCTYLLISDKVRYSRGEGDDLVLCPPYAEARPDVDFLWANRDALDDLEGWNGGPTFKEFLIDDIGQRRIKIGDDFSHLWDVENRRFEMYDLEYMERHIKRVAAQAVERIRGTATKSEPGAVG